MSEEARGLIEREMPDELSMDYCTQSELAAAAVSVIDTLLAKLKEVEAERGGLTELVAANHNTISRLTIETGEQQRRIVHLNEACSAIAKERDTLRERVRKLEAYEREYIEVVEANAWMHVHPLIKGNAKLLGKRLLIDGVRAFRDRVRELEDLNKIHTDHIAELDKLFEEEFGKDKRYRIERLDRMTAAVVRAAGFSGIAPSKLTEVAVEQLRANDAHPWVRGEE